MFYIVLYLHLFSAIKHVSHGKTLYKYARYYYHHNDRKVKWEEYSIQAGEQSTSNSPHQTLVSKMPTS